MEAQLVVRAVAAGQQHQQQRQQQLGPWQRPQGRLLRRRSVPSTWLHSKDWTR